MPSRIENIFLSWIKQDWLEKVVVSSSSLFTKAFDCRKLVSHKNSCLMKTFSVLTKVKDYFWWLPPNVYTFEQECASRHIVTIISMPLSGSKTRLWELCQLVNPKHREFPIVVILEINVSISNTF